MERAEKVSLWTDLSYAHVYCSQVMRNEVKREKCQEKRASLVKKLSEGLQHVVLLQVSWFLTFRKYEDSVK